jgi:Zn-dependent peptidase ImmA (M78 family)
MANYALGVNPAMLQWARKKSGYSLREIAARFKKDVEAIEQWETGEAVPTYNQLEKLAYTYYKRPLAVFFFPEPPEEPGPQESFRTLPNFEFESFLPDTLHAIREAQAMQLSLHELTDGSNPAPNKIFQDLQMDPGMNVMRVAEEVRVYLDISLEEQFEWPKVVAALSHWRESIQEHGVFVFKRSLQQRDISGFCLVDQEFPVIYLNNSTAKTRQIFSIFHELAHLLLDTSGITKRDDSHIAALQDRAWDIEVFCNRFAAEFLVPTHDFNNRLDLNEPIERITSNLSRLYKVSREVILRKLLDKGAVTQDYYEAKAEEWLGEYQRARRRGEGGGNYYATQAVYLGSKYLELAFSSYYSGRCTLQQLSDYLNMKPKTVTKFERYVLNRA